MLQRSCGKAPFGRAHFSSLKSLTGASGSLAHGHLYDVSCNVSLTSRGARACLPHFTAYRPRHAHLRKMSDLLVVSAAVELHVVGAALFTC